MTTETIQNSDLQLGLRCWEDRRPLFSHFVVEHGEPLRSSDNPIISNLLLEGYEIHETLTSYYMGFPSRPFELERHFVARERQEFQIRLADDGFLRFRFEDNEDVYLSLFYIHKSLQGKGLGRKWFKPVTDALFRVGVRSMYGVVASSHYPSKRPTNVNRLTRFYLSEGFESMEDGWIIKISPYFGGSVDSAIVPNSHETGTRRASEMAIIS